MDLSRHLLPFDVDTQKNKTHSNDYQLTKPEMEDLVGLCSFSVDSKQDVRKTVSKEKQLHGKKSMLNYPSHWTLEMLFLQ